MGRACQGTGVQLLTPLWGIGRQEMLQALWALRIEAVVSCVHVPRFRSAGHASNPEQGNVCKAKLPAVPAQAPAEGASSTETAQGAAAATGEAGPCATAAAAVQPGGAASGPCGGPADALPPAVLRLLGQTLTPELLESELAPASEQHGIDLVRGLHCCHEHPIPHWRSKRLK